MFQDTSEFKDIDTNLNNIDELIKLKKGSEKRVNWICNFPCGGHGWNTTIYSRTGLKTGCPICANKIICKCTNKCNSFGFLCKNLLKEWDYDKNQISPYDLFPGSGKVVFWICKKSLCGPHGWSTSINKRTGNRKRGCPTCANKKICLCKNKCNSFGYNHVDIIKEWDYDKNQVSPRCISMF